VIPEARAAPAVFWTATSVFLRVSRTVSVRSRPSLRMTTSSMTFGRLATTASSAVSVSSRCPSVSAAAVSAAVAGRSTARRLT
jgi:hypothetical protein